MATPVHFRRNEAPPIGLLAEHALFRQRAIVHAPVLARAPAPDLHPLPPKPSPGPAQAGGTLTPDWQRAHVVRLHGARDGCTAVRDANGQPGCTWLPGRSLLIVPAIFTPSVNDALSQTMGGTGSSRSLSFTVTGTGSLVAAIHTFHTSAAQSINSATFNSVSMTMGQNRSDELSPENIVTRLAYLHGADITTANITATFSASATNSGIAAYWVTELVNQTAEAGNAGFTASSASLTVNTTTITDSAFIAVGCAAWTSSTVTATSPSVRAVVGTQTNGHVVAAGYRIAGAAGSTGTTWSPDGGSGDEIQIVTNAFEVSAGGGGAVFVPLARRRLSLICR